jgi:hypothetical protein
MGMNQDENERRREKADLLLAIHENDELIGRLKAKLKKVQKALELVFWAMSGDHLKAEAGRLKIEDGSHYPTEESIVQAVEELARAESEQKRLQREMHSD